MRKNVAGQIVGWQAVSSTDGETAITTGTPTVYYTIDGGTQGTGAGTSTHEGNGQWTYAPTQAETNGNHILFTFVLSGSVTQSVNVYPVSFDPTDSVRLGITALPNAAADAAGGLPISDAGGLDLDSVLSGNVPQTGDSYARLGAPAGASVSADIAANQTDLNSILEDTGTTIPALFPASFNTLTVSGGYLEVDLAAIHGTQILEVTAGRLAGNFTTFFANGNAATSATLDDVSDILTDTGTTLPATLTTIEAKVDTVDTVADAILVDTGTTLPATLTTIEGKVDTVDTVADAILVDTGTTLPATLTAISAVTAKLDTGLEDDGAGGYQWTVLSLENGPSGSGSSPAVIADAVWDELLSGHVIAGSAGKTLADILTKFTPVAVVRVAQPTSSNITLVKGDAYDDSAQDALTWTASKSIDGETGAFTIRDMDDTIILDETTTGVTVTCSGTTFKVSLTSAATALLDAGDDYKFDARVIYSSTSKWTVANGIVTVTDHQSRD